MRSAADPRIQPAFFNVNDYISTGDNRKIDWNNIAPRIGFSYDLNADQRTVFFGGYGRYYDRALFRSAAEETPAVPIHAGRDLLFRRTACRINGQPTIKWDPNFLTPAGFAALAREPRQQSAGAGNERAARHPERSEDALHRPVQHRRPPAVRGSSAPR